MLLHTALLKCLIYSQDSYIVHGATISIACTTQLLLIWSEKSFLPFKWYTIPTAKFNRKKNHAYLTDSQYSTCLLKKYPHPQYLWEWTDTGLHNIWPVLYRWTLLVLVTPISFQCHIYQYHLILPQLHKLFLKGCLQVQWKRSFLWK